MSCASRARTPRNAAAQSHRSLKHQRLDLLHLRQRLHLGQEIGRHRAVDLDQRDGVAALLDAAEMEGRDVDLGVA